MEIKLSSSRLTHQFRHYCRITTDKPGMKNPNCIKLSSKEFKVVDTWSNTDIIAVCEENCQVRRTSADFGKLQFKLLQNHVRSSNSVNLYRRQSHCAKVIRIVPKSVEVDRRITKWVWSWLKSSNIYKADVHDFSTNHVLSSFNYFNPHWALVECNLIAFITNYDCDVLRTIMLYFLNTNYYYRRFLITTMYLIILEIIITF